MGPGLTSRGCKGHPKLITTPTNPLTCFLGGLLLILPSTHLLLGLIHLNTILNLLLIRFTLMSNHNLSGIHLNQGGGPNRTLLLLFFLHLLLNHNHYLFLFQDNPRCLLKRTQTPTIDSPNRYTLE